MVDEEEEDEEDEDVLELLVLLGLLEETTAELEDDDGVEDESIALELLEAREEELGVFDELRELDEVA